MKKVISVSMVIAMIFALSACSAAEYTETPVTVAVTDENGEVVTDAQGNTVTEVVTDESGNAKTETKKNITVKEGKTTTTEKSNGQNNDNNSGNGSNNGGNNGNSGDNNNNGNNQGGNGSNNNTTGKDDTTKPTEKPKKRDVTINVVLPFYNGVDTNLTLFYSVDGGKETELETRAVKLENDNFGKNIIEKFVIEDVKGEIDAYIVFKDKDVAITKNSVKVEATGDNSQEGTIKPVTGIEIMDGGMD